MAGGGIGDLFSGVGSALGGALSSLGGMGGGGSAGTSAMGGPDLPTDPTNAPTNVLTNPLVGAEEALGGNAPGIAQPQQQQQQQPPQPPQQPTFTTPPQTAPQQFPSFETMDAATKQPNILPSDQQQAAAADPNQAAVADPNSAQPLTAQAGPAPAAQAAPQTDQSGQNVDQQGDGQQGAQQQKQGQQQRNQNPLTQAGNFLKNIAKPHSAPAPSPLASLLNRGPGGLLQDLMGLTNQVGPAYGPQEYSSQGATEHGYGYGAGEPSPAPPAVSPPTQPAAPQPPPTAAVANAPIAPSAATDPNLAAIAQQAKDQSRVPGGGINWTTSPTQGVTGGPPAPQAPPQATQQPQATPASLTTGTGPAAQPISQGEIRMSPYSRHGMPSMQPTQASVDVSPLQREANDRQMMLRAAQMVSQEVSLRPGNVKAQQVQLETARNRALYGIQGNGRYPDGSRAPRSLAQALQTVGGRYRNEGYSGYYPDYSRQRVSPQQLAAFERDVWNPVMHQGSNKSDVGWGPMTGNASNDPRMGERGMVAKHQYLRGTQGYSMRPAGGDDYFREHVGPGNRLPEAAAPTVEAVQSQQLGQPHELTGIMQATRQMAPGGLPTESWRRSTNVEEARRNPFMTPLSYPTAPTGVDPAVRNDWLAGLQSPQRASTLATQAGADDIDPLLDRLAQQWAMQTMGGPVPMPRPRPRM